MSTKINVGYLISYDYRMFEVSVKQLYDYVDRIVLAIDSDRLTWSGNPFHIDKSFFDDVKRIDIDNKIELYYDSFFVEGLTSMECETRERNMLAKKMGKGWLIQLDVDEYIYDFKVLSEYLKRYWFLMLFPKYTPIAFKGVLMTLFRELPNGFLYIKNNETFPFITNIPNYSTARGNSSIRNFNSNIKVIHQSWARSENEIQQKIENWGHNIDFDTKEFFKFWQNVRLENYREIQNFHPIVPRVWNRLYFEKSNSIFDFIERISCNEPQKMKKISKKKLLKSIVNRMFKSSTC
jgi:hypothetical protein